MLNLLTVRDPLKPFYSSDGDDIVSAIDSNFAAVNRKEIRFLIAASTASDETKALAHYICDGLTDRATIYQAFTDLMSAGGGVLKFSRGTFFLESSLVLVGSNFIFEGEGAATIFFQNNNVNSDTICFGDAVTACNNVTFRNFAIDGNKANQPINNTGLPGAERCGLRLRNDAQNCYYIIVDGVYAHHTKQNGISVESTNYCTVKNCRSEYNDNFGIWWENGSNVNIVNNWTSNNAFAGMKLLSCGSGSVTGNQSKSDNGAGFAAQGVSNVSYLGNVAHRPGWHGGADSEADGFGFSGCRAINFIGNTVFGAYGNGLSVNGTVKSNFIGNTFKRNGQFANNTYSDIVTIP